MLQEGPLMRLEVLVRKKHHWSSRRKYDFKSHLDRRNAGLADTGFKGRTANNLRIVTGHVKPHGRILAQWQMVRTRCLVVPTIFHLMKRTSKHPRIFS